MALPEALCILLLVSASLAFGQRQTLTPPQLVTTRVDVYRATQTGTMLQETQGILGTNSSGQWSFRVRSSPYTPLLEYEYIRHSPFINNAACVYFSFASNWSTVHAFLTTQAGMNNIMDVQLGTFNLSRIVPLPGANYSDARWGEFLAGTNTSGVYTLGIINTGGEEFDHYTKSVRTASTFVNYNFAAYDPSSPVCRNATAASPGPSTDTLTGNQTVNVLTEYGMAPKEARMIASFSNISCLTYQLQGVTGKYTKVNDSAFVPSTTLTRDMTVFVTNTTAAAAWAANGFPPAVPISGNYCFQRTLADTFAPSNATTVYGSGTQASNISTVSGDIVINPTQSCQIVLEDLNPTKDYILWAVNGLNTALSQNATASVRFAARPSGSCAYLEFPDPSYLGDPVPLEYVVPPTPPTPPPPPPTTQALLQEANALFATLQALLAPEGAPVPAPDAPGLPNVPLPPGVANLSTIVDSLAPALSNGLPATVPPVTSGPAMAPYTAPPPSSAPIAVAIQSESVGGNKISGAAIAGIVVAVVAAASAAVIGFLIWRRSKMHPSLLPPANPKEADNGKVWLDNEGSYEATHEKLKLPNSTQPGDDGKGTMTAVASQPRAAFIEHSVEPPQAFTAPYSFSAHSVDPPQAFAQDLQFHSAEGRIQTGTEGSAEGPRAFSAIGPEYDSAKTDDWPHIVAGSSSQALPQLPATQATASNPVVPYMGVPSVQLTLPQPFQWGPSATSGSAHSEAGGPDVLQQGDPSHSSGQQSNERASRSRATSGSGSMLEQASGDDLLLEPSDIEYVLDRDGNPVSLGEGSFGTVYKCKLGRQHSVAVKEVHGKHTSAQMANMMREVQLLKSCRHPNIVQYMGASFEDGKIKLVMEEMAGDLFHALARPGNEYSWYKRGHRVAMDIAQGLVYLHWRKIIHFDLKSGNVLLTQDGTAKLTDVGLSGILASDKTHLSEAQGFTFAWASPEVLLGQPCTPKADMYSLGVVLYEIAAGHTPRRGGMREIRVPQECPQEVVDLIQRCTDPNPAARPSAQEVVEFLEELQSMQRRAS